MSIERLEDRPFVIVADFKNTAGPITIVYKAPTLEEARTRFEANHRNYFLHSVYPLLPTPEEEAKMKTVTKFSNRI